MGGREREREEGEIWRERERRDRVVGRRPSASGKPVSESAQDLPTRAHTTEREPIGALAAPDPSSDVQPAHTKRREADVERQHTELVPTSQHP